ncbi:MAG: hypothetical protein JWQ30_831 [Sediminibacterium sp.]|nr:hypothetical protein [Sediminibacterium sp.]
MAMRNSPAFIIRVVIVMMMVYAAGCTKSDPDNGGNGTGNGETKPKPNITSFAPQTAADDEPVKISGKYFSGATSVSFGGTAAKSFVVVSDSVITARLATGASGEISVTTAGGTHTMAGFTYYTPASYNLLGTTIYGNIPWPQRDSNYYTFKTKADTCSLVIRQINPYDSARLWTQEDPYASKYVNQPNYVILSGVLADPYAYASYSFSGNKGYSIFAELKNGIIIIPTQMPVYGLVISGSGTLQANKLTLKYTTEYRGNSKNSTFTSQ